MIALCIFISVHEIPLSHWNYIYGVTGKKPAISSDFVSFGVNLHARSGAVQDHGMFANFPRVRDREKLLRGTIRLSRRSQGLADEGKRTFCGSAAECTEHWPVIFRLWIRNGGVGIPHD